MRISSVIAGVGWIIFWIYWIISAFNSKKNIRPTNSRSFFGARLGLIIIAALSVILFNQLPKSFTGQPVTTNGLLEALGLVIFLAGFSLAIWARVTLGKNWGMPMTEKQEPELVSNGPYQYVRHPIYTGLFAMAAGSALCLNPYWIIVFAVSVIYLTYSAIKEEKTMSSQFPKVYPSYKRRTKMLIPLIF